MVDKLQYKKRLESGLCGLCGRNLKFNGIHCKKCWERHKRFTNKRYFRLRDAGLCTQCGKNPSVRRSFCNKCLNGVKENQKKYYYRARDIVLDYYGCKCTCCSESEKLFLEIDHINNDGSKYMGEIGRINGLRFYRWIIKNNFPKDLQILCSNCNKGKHRNGGICPHRTRKEHERKV